MIRDKNTKMERWKVHFSEVLNRETPDNPISEYEEIDIEDIQVDTREIRESEVREAIKKTKNEKAPGVTTGEKLRCSQYRAKYSVEC